MKLRLATQHTEATKNADAAAAPAAKWAKTKNEPPTFGEQIQVIKNWWQTIKERYVQEHNKYEPVKANHLELHRITDVPLDKVYDFVIKKHIVQDRQMATKLVS